MSASWCVQAVLEHIPYRKDDLHPIEDRSQNVLLVSWNEPIPRLGA